jgi:hypothetical protein
MAGFLLLALMTAFLGSEAQAGCVSRAKNNLLLCQSHGGDGSAWGMANCSMCHSMQTIHRGAAAQNIRGIVLKKGKASCMGCHGDNGTGRVRPCSVCHNKVDLPTKPIRAGKRAHDFTVAKVRPLKEGNCRTCHLNSDMDGQFEPKVDLTPLRNAQGKRARPATIGQFCIACHNRTHQLKGYRMHVREDRGLSDPLVAMEENFFACNPGGTAIDWHGCRPGERDVRYSGLRQPTSYHYADENPAQPDQPIECTDCHAMHGSHNAKLIIPSARAGVTGMSAEFRKDPAHRVTVTGKNYAQLCVLCHQMPIDPAHKLEQEACDTGNGLSGVHNAGLEASAACGSGTVQGTADCEECHQHGGALTIGPGL